MSLTSIPIKSTTRMEPHVYGPGHAKLVIDYTDDLTFRDAADVDRMIAELTEISRQMRTAAHLPEPDRDPVVESVG